MKKLKIIWIGGWEMGFLCMYVCPRMGKGQVDDEGLFRLHVPQEVTTSLQANPVPHDRALASDHINQSRMYRRNSTRTS